MFILNRSHAINYLAERTNFSHQALDAIADHLAEDTDNCREVDPVQLEGDWREASQLTDLIRDYNHVSGFPTDIQDDEAVITWFTQNTVFIPFQYADSTRYVLLNF